ncbi:MAG: hypothetical protein ACKO3T_21860 [Planctomycetaceae bacterium]
MTMLVPSILLLLTSLGAGIFFMLLLGYVGLLLVRAVFRSLQGSAAPAMFVPQQQPQPVRPVQPVPQPQLAAPAGSTGRLSFSAVAALGVLAVAVGVALMLFNVSARRMEFAPPRPVVVDWAQPASQLSFNSDGMQTQQQPGKIPVQPEPAVSPQEDRQQAARPAAANRAQLLEVASQLGQFFQSQLNRPAAESAVTGDGQAAATADQEVAAGTAGESADGDVVVYQFSEQMLADLFGSEAIDTLRSLSQQMPAGIRNSYALIPLPGSVGATVPPMKPLLASSGLRSLADSLVELLKTGPAGGRAAAQQSQADAQPAAEQPNQLPAWVRQPAAGHRVARAEVLPGEDVSERVRESVEELLQQELSSAAEWIPTGLRSAAMRASVGVSAETVNGLVQRRFERMETLEQPIDGAGELQVVWTEIELPQAELVGQLSQVASQHRGWLLLAGLLVFWAGLLLMTVAVRLWHVGGLISRAVSMGTGVLSIGLLLAVVLIVLQSARGTSLSTGQLAGGAVVWSFPNSSISLTL